MRISWKSMSMISSASKISTKSTIIIESRERKNKEKHMNLCDMIKFPMDMKKNIEKV